MVTCLLPSAPPGLEATLMLDPGPGEVPEAVAAPLPALLEIAISAGSNPSGGDLWSMPPRLHLSQVS